VAATGIIEDGVIDKLLAATAVTAVVSTRIYPRIADQTAAKPFLVVQLGEGQQTWHHSGARSGQATTNISVACVAGTYKAARALGYLVELALDKQTGLFGAEVVRHCLHQGTFDRSANPQDDDEIGITAVGVDFSICHTVPTS
jgi:hypothetical protein